MSRHAVAIIQIIKLVKAEIAKQVNKTQNKHTSNRLQHEEVEQKHQHLVISIDQSHLF